MRRRTTEEKVRFGLYLRSQKDVLPHGEFMKWVEQTLNIDVSTAERYMRLSKEAISVYDAERSSHV